MELEIPKDVMIYVMPTFDCIIAILLFYMGAMLTQNWGFGSRRELLLAAHRLMIFIGSASFAWHAFDIFRDPHRHGLTLSNFELHLVVVGIVIVSSIRMTVAEKRIYKPNGDGFTGPFHQNAQSNRASYSEAK
jgi:hypothetical protein